MTAASQHLASPASPASRWERVLIVLGICLPVPLFAASGLTIPLPATVERLAAALVPWVETAMVDSNGALLRGTIILTPGEQAESTPGRDVPAAVVSEHVSSPDGTSQGSEGGKATKETKGTGAGAEPQPDSPGAGPVTTPGESKPEPAPKPGSGEEPGGEPGPVQGTVDTVGETVGSAVGTVEDTADEVLTPVGGLQDTLEGTVTGILPGLGG